MVPSESDYDRACAEIDESEEAEHELYKEQLLSEGVRMCRFDEDNPCNMAVVTKEGVRLCQVIHICRGLENMFYCDRIRFRGGQGYNSSIFERFQHGDLLDGAGSGDKKPDEPCLFDKGVCKSEIGVARCGNPASPCVFGLPDKIGLGSQWFCGRIRFNGSKTSIAQKVTSQHLLDGKRGMV